MTPSFSLAFWHFKRNALISRKCYYLFKLIIKEKKRGSFRTQCCNSILKSNLGFNVCTFWIYIFIKQGGRLRNIFIKKYAFQWLLRWLRGKESACNAGVAGDAGSIPGSGRSPGGGNGNLLSYSCLKSPMDRGTWRVIVHGVTKSQIWLRDWAQTCFSRGHT